MASSFRTFVAIELPHDLRARIIQYAKELRSKFPDVRASWTREENLHLTLKFLGDVSASDIEELSRAVEASAMASAPFEIVVSGCGAFPPQGDPKVLWIGITDELAQLNALHDSLERECERAGFSREARPFRPHLTIARIRAKKNARQLARAHATTNLDPASVTVRELIVMRSQLSSEGSQYTPLARHRLSGAIETEIS